jgi:hypothetical protein
MDFKKSIEKNPMTYLVTCIIATASLTAGVQQYFVGEEAKITNAKHISEVDDLNSKLASLRRGLPGSEFLDIRNILYSPGAKVNAPPGSSTFFPEQFYAPKAASDWLYEETSELALLNDLSGGQLQSGLPSGLQSASTLLKVHAWRGKKVFQIKEHEFFKKVYPLISVEKVLNGQFHAILGFAAQDIDQNKSLTLESRTEDAKKALEKPQSDSEDFVNSLDKIFRGDVVGTFFTSQLSAQLMAAVVSPKTRFNLVEVQKVGNVLYAQILVTLKNVNVDGQSCPEFYLRKEMIVIALPDGAVVVQTLVPSADPAPRDIAFAEISKWLTDFRVVIA